MQNTTVALNRQAEIKSGVEEKGFACVPNDVIDKLPSVILVLYMYFLWKGYRMGGVISIPLKQMMSELGVKKRQLINNINKLVEEKCIEKVNRGQYRVIIPRGNFVKVFAVLFLDRKLPVVTLKAYVKFLSFKNREDNYCCPFIKTIADDFNSLEKTVSFSESTIKRHIKTLVKFKLIEVKKESLRNGCSRNIYIFPHLENRYCKPENILELKEEHQKRTEEVLDVRENIRKAAEKNKAKRTENLLKGQAVRDRERRGAKIEAAKNKQVTVKAKRKPSPEDLQREEKIDQLDKIYKAAAKKKYPKGGVKLSAWGEHERKLVGDHIGAYTYEVLKNYIPYVFENWEFLVQTYNLTGYPSIRIMFSSYAESWILVSIYGEAEKKSKAQMQRNKAEWPKEEGYNVLDKFTIIR